MDKRSMRKFTRSAFRRGARRPYATTARLYLITAVETAVLAESC